MKEIVLMFIAVALWRIGDMIERNTAAITTASATTSIVVPQ